MLQQIHAGRLALPLALLLLLQRGVPRAQLLQLGYELQQGSVVLCEAGCLRIQALVLRVLHALHRWRHCMGTAVSSKSTLTDIDLKTIDKSTRAAGCSSRGIRFL